MDGYLLVFAGIPTWGYLLPIAWPFIILLVRWGKKKKKKNLEEWSPYSLLRGDEIKISEAIGQVMVINGKDGRIAPELG